ncbi:GNAT family N-acetyltransferase [Tetragenococcus halophilus]|nr:GNAT family N-acetyltransferase [Tetragenococcus halophilus]
MPNCYGKSDWRWGTVFHVVDIAVNPSYQRKGLGKKVMTEIMGYLDTHTFKGSYVSLIADSPADKLYQQFGFCYTAPGSVGCIAFIEVKIIFSSS